MLLLLHPDPSPELVRAVIFHDVAERWTGDMPAPMKWWINPRAGTMVAETEAEILIELDLARRLSLEDTKWLKALDILELFLFAKDELNLGNHHMQELHNVCHRLIFNSEATPPEILTWARSSTEVRTSDKVFMKEQ